MSHKSKRNVVHFDFKQCKKPKYEWKPKNVKCYCDIRSWNMNQYCFESKYEITCDATLLNIREHIYDHIFGQFLSQSCTTIVESYVGPIYINYKRKFFGYYVQFRVITLGLHFINNNIVDNMMPIFDSDGLNNVDNMMSMFDSDGLTCRIQYCGAQSLYESPMCEEHDNQYNELPNTYFHLHACNECFIKLKPHYLSVIAKLNTTLYHDIINHIFSFCDVKSLCKCQGHIHPRKYKCDECLVFRHNRLSINI
jgi:hypothetical protein